MEKGKEFRVGVIRVLTSEDQEFVDMHGNIIEQHYPGTVSYTHLGRECIRRAFWKRWRVSLKRSLYHITRICSADGTVIHVFDPH